jgi:hypothetical protein
MFQKYKFYASFQFYFLYIFFVKGNLVSKYEKLLIFNTYRCFYLDPHDTQFLINKDKNRGQILVYSPSSIF